MIKFFIEISYWAAYFMKWKSEKEIPFISGIDYTMLMIFCHIMAILMIIHLYTPYSITDRLPSLSSEVIFKAEDRLTWIFRLLPFLLFIQFLIARIIYKRTSKKELLESFEKMPPNRQTKGKAIFVIYSLCSIIFVFVFGIQLTNQREALREDDNSLIRQERIELFREQLKQIDSTKAE